MSSLWVYNNYFISFNLLFMNKNKVGLAFGSFVGFVHLIWSVLIALGWAQPWMDFVYRMHSLNNPFTVAPFDLVRSGELVVITFVVGYVVGFIFATIWNKVRG